MLAIPFPLQARFKQALQNKPIPDHLQGFYKKWLQYYLDFCAKYDYSPGNKESLSHFIAKLRQKKQTETQQEQAIETVGLYYEIIGSVSKNETWQKTQPPPLELLILIQRGRLSVRWRKIQSKMCGLSLHFPRELLRH